MLNYRKLAIEIAKLHPSIFLSVYKNLEDSSDLDFDTSPISWSEFGWFDDVIYLIKKYQDLRASYIIYNYYNDIGLNDARKIVQEIKTEFVNPVLPVYARYFICGNKVEVRNIVLDDKLMGSGNNKHEAALEAWEWHKKYTLPANLNNVVLRG